MGCLASLVLSPAPLNSRSCHHYCRPAATATRRPRDCRYAVRSRLGVLTASSAALASASRPGVGLTRFARQHRSWLVPIRRRVLRLRPFRLLAPVGTATPVYRGRQTRAIVAGLAVDEPRLMIGRRMGCSEPQRNLGRTCNEYGRRDSQPPGESNEGSAGEAVSIIAVNSVVLLIRRFRSERA